MLRIFLCLLILFGGTVAPVWADEAGEPRTVADEAHLKELINQLGSQVKTEWQAVVKELVETGEVAVPFLEEAVESSNAVLARRAKILLRKINQRKLAGNFEASTVTCRMQAQPVKKVLEALQMQTGNEIELGQLKDTAITVDFDRTRFWSALDTIARLSGNFYGEDPARAGG